MLNKKYFLKFLEGEMVTNTPSAQDFSKVGP